MLRYYANGRIRWKDRMPCNTRTNWEFYAVIDGRCGPVFRDGARPALSEKTLWIFAPECAHAWVDDGRHTFHRIAFHFGNVPYPLDEIVRARGWFAKKLTDADIARLQAIAAELAPHFCQPNLLSPICFQGRLMDLAALALAEHAQTQPPALHNLANFKVERALSWYAEHVAGRPSVKEVAEATHISISHLRRLFTLVRHVSPKTAFRRLRIEKANDLMSRTDLTLEDVARHCGYANASHFCREYKGHHRFTPTHWRKHLVAGYTKPLPPGVVHVREFSARAIERTMSA